MLFVSAFVRTMWRLLNRAFNSFTLFTCWLWLVFHHNVTWIFVRERVSKYVHAHNVCTFPYEEDVVRSVVRKLPTPDLKPNTLLSHPVDNASRGSAEKFMQLVAEALGMPLWIFQMSKSDQFQGLAGYRTYYDVADLNIDIRQDPIPDGAAIGIVDVDYHIKDVAGFLASRKFRNRMFILFTVTPTKVASQHEGNTAYTFEQNGTMTFRIQGTKMYNHFVYNYSDDNILVTKYRYMVPVYSTSYRVYRHRVNSFKSIVLLIPTMMLNFPINQFFKMFPEKPLRRLDPRVGDSLYMIHMAEDGLKCSIGEVGYYFSANMDITRFETCVLEARALVNPITLGNTETLISGNRQEAAMIIKLVRQKENVKHPEYVVANPPRIRKLIFEEQGIPHEPEAKSSGDAFMSPFLDEAYWPARCKANDQRMIDGRVNARKNTRPLTPAILQYAKEFLAFMFPIPEILVPVDNDELRERQSTRTQIHILDDAEGMGADERVYIKAFMKAEAAQKIADPRNISTLPPKLKADYSMVIYSLMNYIHDYPLFAPWYASGLTPRNVAEKVASICRQAKSHVANTDYTRYDGGINDLARVFETMLLARAFKPAYKSHVLDLHSKQYQVHASTRFGVKYNTAYTRASGSPETAVMNAAFNAFMSYMAFRIGGLMVMGLEPTQAYDALGAYVGDDGLNADIDPDAMSNAAHMCGQELKCDIIKKDALGVSFLARLYSPYVWRGELDSMCDIHRQLAKFHSSAKLPDGCSNWTKLYMKCLSFRNSDGNTPVLGPFIHKVMDIATTYPPNAAHVESFRKIFDRYLSVDDPNQDYPNQSHPWMLDVFRRDLPFFTINEFTAWIKLIDSPEMALSPPHFHPPIDPKSHKTHVCHVGDVRVHPERPASSTVETIAVSGVPKQKYKPPNKRGQTKIPSNTAIKREARAHARAARYQAAKKKLP